MNQGSTIVGTTPAPGPTIDDWRSIAEAGRERPLKNPEAHRELIRLALLIREVELKFLELFSEGRMNGTVHTCIGQEFSAAAIAGQLSDGDWITSNHRCHGHFIAKTGNWQGLIDELMGLESGICKGIGSSQHLFSHGFLSNGPQGALVPVAAGIALYQKQRRHNGIAVSFIGEGTLGEGVVYETMNLASLWSLPQLIVCENNFYSQSTPQSAGVSGSIIDRPRAFGIATFEADTWDIERLLSTARNAINHVRNTCSPAFLLVRTYRLKAHSKGDDDRSPDEVEYFETLDPLNRLLSLDWVRELQADVSGRVNAHVSSRCPQVVSYEHYSVDQLPRRTGARSTSVSNDRIRLVHALNRAYRQRLEQGTVLLGEDIADPYGGAFKVTRGLSSDFPEQVLTTPISEAAIAGVGTGLAMMGCETYVEIMFGDFMTNVFDQLISNISKFHHMYAFQASVPVRLRTPMGGKRGYGPTHSQSLEKFLVGLDNVLVLALSSLEDPMVTLSELGDHPGPAVIIEDKVDYGKTLWQPGNDFELVKSGGDFGCLIANPKHHRPNATLVTYGGTAREILDGAERLFVETDVVPQIIVLIKLHPFDPGPMLRSLKKTRRLIVVEDGSTAFGIGAEIVACAAESGLPITVQRIGAHPVPVPSVAELERRMLPTLDTVIDKLRRAPSAVDASSFADDPLDD